MQPNISPILLLFNIFISASWSLKKPLPFCDRNNKQLNLCAFQRNNSLNLNHCNGRENHLTKSIIAAKAKTANKTSLLSTTTMNNDEMNNSSSRISNRPKLIAVIGASGTQGGSIVRAFHELKLKNDAAKNKNDTDTDANTATSNCQEFEIRAITRNIQTSSDKMDTIKHMVKEIVQADCNDYDSMVKAFEGCYGAFVMTNFWPECDMTKEIETTKIIQMAAKKANLEHVVLSTFEDTRESPYIHQDHVDGGDGKGQNAGDNPLKILDEKYGSYVPHFDGKAEAAKLFASEVPTTKLLTSFYYENFLHASRPTRQENSDPDGAVSYSYALTLPMGSSKMALVAAKDIGRCAAHLFTDKRYIGTTHGVASEIMTCEEIVSTFSEVFGVKFFHNNIPTKVYASFGFPGAADLANMYSLFQQYETEYLSFRSLHQVRQKIGTPVTLAEWLIENKALLNF